MDIGATAPLERRYIMENLKITKKEYYFLKAFDNSGNDYGYISREYNNDLSLYCYEPYKLSNYWACKTDPAPIWLDKNMFGFIKFRDEKAWSIRDLLKLGAEYEE